MYWISSRSLVWISCVCATGSHTDAAQPAPSTSSTACCTRARLRSVPHFRRSRKRSPSRNCRTRVGRGGGMKPQVHGAKESGCNQSLTVQIQGLLQCCPPTAARQQQQQRQRRQQQDQLLQQAQPHQCAVESPLRLAMRQLLELGHVGAQRGDEGRLACLAYRSGVHQVAVRKPHMAQQCAAPPAAMASHPNLDKPRMNAMHEMAALRTAGCSHPTSPPLATLTPGLRVGHGAEHAAAPLRALERGDGDLTCRERTLSIFERWQR